MQRGNNGKLRPRRVVTDASEKFVEQAPYNVIIVYYVFRYCGCVGLSAVVDDVWYTGVWRGCATAAMVDCTTVTNEPVPELHLTDATVEMCYCTGHLCNAARRRHVLVGGGTAAGGVIVAALLALAGARFVGA